MLDFLTFPSIIYTWMKESVILGSKNQNSRNMMFREHLSEREGTAMYTPKGELSDKLLEAMKDQEFVKKITDASNKDVVLAAVQEVDPSITMDGLKEQISVMQSYLEESQEGVLSDDDLDLVAGGSKAGAKQFFSDFGDGFAVGWSGTIKVLGSLLGV